MTQHHEHTAASRSGPNVGFLRPVLRRVRRPRHRPAPERPLLGPVSGAGGTGRTSGTG
jgi:hypothetical protein